MQNELNQYVTFRLNKGGEKKEDHGILEKIKGAFISEVSKGIL